jgi:hypothetical protein
MPSYVRKQHQVGDMIQGAAVPVEFVKGVTPGTDTETAAIARLDQLRREREALEARAIAAGCRGNFRNSATSMSLARSARSGLTRLAQVNGDETHPHHLRGHRR